VSTHRKRQQGNYSSTGNFADQWRRRTSRGGITYNYWHLQVAQRLVPADAPRSFQSHVGVGAEQLPLHWMPL
jgi:hypothetical protein